MRLPNLLVVDDDAQIRRLFARSLGGRFVIDCAEDAETALAMIDAGALYDVILCDLNLPGMSGHGFYDQLEKRGSEGAARLVIITGSEPAADDPFARMLGARYVQKPWSTPALAAMLSEIAFAPVSSPAATG